MHGLRIQKRGTLLLAVPELEMSVPGIIGISGPSGSGKSLFCEVLLGMTGPEVSIEGECAWDGRQQVVKGRMQLVPGREVCWIGGDPRSLLDPLQRCGRQLRDAFRVGRRRVSPAEATRAAEDMLGRLGIDDPQRRLNNYPHEISGGMAQRMVIAAALLTTAPIIVLDDALVGLDATLEMQITDLLATLVREEKRCMVFVTHDPLLAEFVAEDVYMLHDRELVAVGNCAPEWDAFKSLVVLGDRSNGG